jgi:NitT/TauT family transport system ATP-binding protein
MLLDTRPEPAPAPLLEIQQLSHWFLSPGRQGHHEGIPVLADIHLHVEPGEIVVLLGPSGCGKSTLLNLASGLKSSQQGEIRLRGKRIRGPDPRLGLVFQQPALLPWLTVRGNVEFGLTLRHSEHLSVSQRRERIHTTLQLVGLPIDPETAPAHLSGGMAQRVALARVLVRNPSLLLLDEPFSALDAVTRSEMQDLLLRIVDQTGTGILIVTHDVDEAIQLGDRILLMRSQPGAIAREWIGRRTRPEFERHDLRREVLESLTDMLKSRSP